MPAFPPVQDPPRPPAQSDSSGNYRDAKAEAKSAQAYAKSQRPWYKKKRFNIPLGLVVLVIAAQAVNGGGATTNDSASSGGGGGTSGKVGQALTNAGTTYTVTKAETTATIGDPNMFGERADGIFVLVSLELTNTKDETKTFLDSSSKLVTSDGKAYETSDKAVLSFGDESLMLKDIQPDLTTRGKLAFELPPNKVSGSTLVVEDLFGSGEIKVDLGL